MKDPYIITCHFSVSILEPGWHVFVWKQKSMAGSCGCLLVANVVVVVTTWTPPYHPVWVVPNVLSYITWGHFYPVTCGDLWKWLSCMYGIIFCIGCSKYVGLILTEHCECFLRFATGDKSPLEACNSFRTLCTNDSVTYKERAIWTSLCFACVATNTPCRFILCVIW